MNTPNTPSASSRRPVTSPANSAVRAPAIVLLARDAHTAANDDAVTAAPDYATNPLWMMTAGLAIFFAAMALLVSS